jgi:predicted O-methyltransferase YrrM
LLRTLTTAKPGANVLELGTGTGLATAWLLAGMDATARMISVENDAGVAAVAQRHLGHDLRVRFVIADAGAFLATVAPQSVDLIFADTWAGKYTHLEETLRLLKPGGLYVVDDMLPQPNWPDGHAAKVVKLIDDLEQRTDLVLTKLSWASGMIVAAKVC